MCLKQSCARSLQGFVAALHFASRDVWAACSLHCAQAVPSAGLPAGQQAGKTPAGPMHHGLPHEAAGALRIHTAEASTAAEQPAAAADPSAPASGRAKAAAALQSKDPEAKVRTCAPPRAQDVCIAGAGSAHGPRAVALLVSASKTITFLTQAAAQPLCDSVAVWAAMPLRLSCSPAAVLHAGSSRAAGAHGLPRQAA